jgi:hypothetical protein
MVEADKSKAPAIESSPDFELVKDPIPDRKLNDKECPRMI